MKSHLLNRAIACFMTMVLIKTASAQTFEGLGYLYDYEFSDSQAMGVSGDGSVIVGTTISLYNGTVVKEAFRWTENDGMQGLGALWLQNQRFFSQGLNISSDGNVIVGYSKSENSFNPFGNQGWEAFRWTEDEGMQGLGDLASSNFWSEARSVSSDGSTIVGRGAFINQGFRWENGVMEDLPGFNAAWGVSADGSIVVGTCEIDGMANQACMWIENEGVFGLGTPENTISTAQDISADGTTIVGYIFDEMGNPSPSFRWRENEGLIELGSLGGAYTAAESVSDDGSVIVGAATTQNNDFVAFIWTEENGMRNLKEVMETTYGLDLTGWTLSAANAVSGDGSTIVGTGLNPDGKQEAWRVVIPANTGPDCQQPSDVTVNNITTTTADVSWMENGDATQWEIEYGETGSSQSEGVLISDNDGIIGETINGLEPATQYDVYVRAICESNESDWLGPVGFTTEIPPCLQPSNIIADTVTDSVIFISWTENGDASQWEIEYGETGFTQGEGTTVLDNDGMPGEAISGLEEETDYDVYVRAICEFSQSEWTGPVTFNTEDMGINEQENQMVLYPNPTSGIINLQTTEKINAVSVYNSVGQEVEFNSLNKENTSIDLSNLSSGIYFVETVVNNNTIKKYKVIRK